MILGEFEKIILKKAANLFRGFEAVGGWISLTNERFIFEPHRMNVQTAPLELQYQDIENIEKRNTWGIIPNGIRITLKTGKQYKFVTYTRNKLIMLVNEMVHKKVS